MFEWLQVQGKALLFIIVLGLGGSFQVGCHLTLISSPSPVRIFLILSVINQSIVFIFHLDVSCLAQEAGYCS